MGFFDAASHAGQQDAAEDDGNPYGMDESDFDEENVNARMGIDPEDKPGSDKAAEANDQYLLSKGKAPMSFDKRKQQNASGGSLTASRTDQFQDSFARSLARNGFPSY